MAHAQSLEHQPPNARTIVAIPERVVPARHVRGTLLVSSRVQVKALGVFDAYERALAPSDRSALTSTIAASWVPAELVHAHYRAVDSLEIPESTILTAQVHVANRVFGVFLSTAARASRAIGATPWASLPLVAKVWPRMLDGGAIGVERIGPREALMRIVGNPFVVHRFHRIAIRSHIQTGVAFLTEQTSVRETACNPKTGTADIVVRWT